MEKKEIFRDQQDYSVFLSYLQEYLLPKDEDGLNQIIQDWHSSPEDKLNARKLLNLNNFTGEIFVLAYCLMPNHFHFLIKQGNANSIDKFMNSLMTRYTMYFNKKYKRVGSLYQGVYNAVLVFTDEQLFNLSKYIHKQALSIPSLTGSGQPSSYAVFTGSEKSEWVYPEEILAYLSEEYPKFTYKTLLNEESDWDLIHNFTLETSP
ncbi:MAG: transposase [Candidatus Daviesbacteria bacterium]|nr:transposase [Candidatus Daviesbacteria bacterium]